MPVPPLSYPGKPLVTGNATIEKDCKSPHRGFLFPSSKFNPCPSCSTNHGLGIALADGVLFTKTAEFLIPEVGTRGQGKTCEAID